RADVLAEHDGLRTPLGRPHAGPGGVVVAPEPALGDADARLPAVRRLRQPRPARRAARHERLPRAHHLDHGGEPPDEAAARARRAAQVACRAAAVAPASTERAPAASTTPYTPRAVSSVT